LQPIIKDEIEILLEIGESCKELAVERDHLVYAIKQELGRLRKDGILTLFLAILGVGSMLSIHTAEVG